MNCASCGRANRDRARFYGGCGSSLALRCPACGAESEPDAQFCDACGASLAARPADAAAARKVVTIVFADLGGSTALHERLDAESARLFMERACMRSSKPQSRHPLRALTEIPLLPPMLSFVNFPSFLTFDWYLASRACGFPMPARRVPRRRRAVPGRCALAQTRRRNSGSATPTCRQAGRSRCRLRVRDGRAR